MEIKGFLRESFNSDSDFLQALIDAEQGGHVALPSGTFLIDKPVVITNGSSLTMNSDTVLLATAEMDYVLSYKEDYNAKLASSSGLPILKKPSEIAGHPVLNGSKRISGGTIDGAGLANGIYVSAFRHMTVSDMTIINGKKYNLYVDGGVELYANNLHIRTTMSGLAGNVGVYANGGDNHYSDIVVIDCTIGMFMDNYDAGANRLFRCHVWGGPIPPLPGEKDCEYLKDSIGFKIVSGENVLRDCYADTAKIGFDIHNWTRMIGCAYYNNYRFGLDDVTIIKKNNDDPLLIKDCFLKKSCPNCTLFEGDGTNVMWRDNILFELEQPEFAQGGLSYFLPEGHPDTSYAR